MAARIRAHDWAATPLGPIEGWPQPLRFALGVALGSSFPSAIYWGPDFRLLYNDAWAPIPADRHPWALGRPGAEVWADIWHLVGPELERVRATGEGYATFDQMLPMERDGVPRETWWNYSFTPIRDEDGNVVGVLNQGNETTRMVLAERARMAEVERLRELFQQAPGAVALLHGPDHVFELANAAYLDLVGRDVIGKTVAEALPEVREQGFIQLLDQVFASGRAHRGTSVAVRLARTAGAPQETRSIDFVYQPILNAAGDTTDIFVQVSDVTERVAAEDALRGSEERLQLALNASTGIGIWDWSAESGCLTADARFAALFGLGSAQAQGRSFRAVLSLVHPADRPVLRRAVRDALRTGSPMSVEVRVTRADGALRWLLVEGRAILDAGGAPVRFPGVSVDITARRAAEEAARATAEELREATESQAFIYALAERQRTLGNPEAVMQHTAQALARQIGAGRVGFYRVLDDGTLVLGPSAVTGAMPLLSGTVDTAKVGAEVLDTYRSGRTLVIRDVEGDPRLADSDIATRTRAAIGVPLLRAGHWVATLYVNEPRPRDWTAEEVAFVEGVAEIAWDAVERANALLALRESEEKFRAIANSIDQMIWATRPDGYHDYFNDRWYEFTGVPYGSTDGDGWNDLFHPQDRERARAYWQHCLATGDTYHIEYRLRHHGDGYRWVLGRAKPVRDADGRITRWFGTCTDIQEIVDAREVLARSREELEALVQERTARLMAAEERLRQAQKMEAVGQLTGGIAHDFNNMLAVVIGALDLLERRLAQGNTDVERYVTAARDGATRAAALTQRLLAFSRQQPLAAAPLDLNEMIEGMVELLVRTIGEGVTVETHLPAGLPLAIADRNQLENVVLNLSVNARDAMPEGGLLRIATARASLTEEAAQALELAAGDYLCIAVTDTGTGMAPEVAARAFDPFFTTKGVGKGTGLGLSQVFGYARQSGGAVEIETRPGRGTTVRLYLPPYHGPAPLAAPAPARRALPRARNGETVLVVEDEERVRSYSIEALRELGYTVIDARDGREALRLLERGQRVSLLFSDVVMPEMTGRELAARARALMPGLRVLLTSGYAPDVAGAEAESILPKPFDIETLAYRVRAQLDAGSSPSGG